MFSLSEELMSEAVYSPSLGGLSVRWGNSQDVDSSTALMEPTLEAVVHNTSPVGWSVTWDNT